MPPPPGVRKLQRSLAREEVYRTLHEWIITGAYHPGEQMRDLELAELLGVSRTPVREALRRLEDEGFVHTHLNRWTRVAPVDVTAAHTHFPIIWGLERLALELSAGRYMPSDLDKLDMTNAEIASALHEGSGHEAAELDERFHGLLTRHCDNAELVQLIDGQRTRLRRFAHRYFDGNMVAERSVVEHQAVVDALRAGDFEGAASAIVSHWRASYGRQVDALARDRSERVTSCW
jgi:DNA-binding GntR family transcriptional regulator